ncbi:MAG TPA: thioredoxin domain-containing protein [Prochlorococcaceae cyanobacterium AMR_MDS_5431]|nr:thioredoxin domain-containing protein [Prochlorococcaceae cyanobacterium AMR_MDS_5431]
METKDSFTPPREGQSSQTMVREWEKVLLLLAAVFLSIILLILKGNLKADGPLNRLARNSLDLQLALTNGRPTLLEFYADWCKVCREMAFTIEEIKIQEQDTLNIVLLNIDNPQWQQELEKYGVTGIPHIELFDSSGLAIGKIIGAHTRSDIQKLTQALISKTTLPKLPGIGPITVLSQGIKESE